MATPGVIVCSVAGVILRFALFRSSLPKWFASKTEVSTPLTSWNRAMEGLSLQDNLISPYTGDVFHETPLMLRLLQFLTNWWPGGVNYIFVGLDVLCAWVLIKISNRFGRYLLRKQMNDVKKYATDVAKIIIKKEDLLSSELCVILVHFLNPFGVAACLGRSTALFDNLTVLLSVYFMLAENEIFCCFFIALAAYQSLYPVVLIAPAALFFYQLYNPKSESYMCQRALLNYCRTTALCVLWLAALIAISGSLEGSWTFLHSTYGFILTVPDLTPNLGVFWYFFTEMFEHFRIFFLCVFQINAIIYTVPMSVKLRDQPVFLMYLLIFIIGIFKSYPSFGDVTLFLSLLPLWKHTFQYMRNSFVVACMFLCSTVFAPILWHLWIYAGSANANFYFAISLVFATAEIFLVTDLLFAFLRREYDLTHGVEHKLENGKQGQVTLE